MNAVLLILGTFLSTVTFAFGNQRPCTVVPHACLIKSAAYTIAQIDGDYKAEIKFPQLEKQNCQMFDGGNGEATFDLPTGVYVEATFTSPVTRKVTQTVKYSTVYCDDSQIRLGTPSKWISIFNFDFLDIDKKTVRLKRFEQGDYDQPSSDQSKKLDKLDLY